MYIYICIDRSIHIGLYHNPIPLISSNVKRAQCMPPENEVNRSNLCHPIPPDFALGIWVNGSHLITFHGVPPLSFSNAD